MIKERKIKILCVCADSNILCWSEINSSPTLVYFPMKMMNVGDGLGVADVPKPKQKQQKQNDVRDE